MELLQDLFTIELPKSLTVIVKEIVEGLHLTLGFVRYIMQSA